jgi:histone H3/H4
VETFHLDSGFECYSFCHFHDRQFAKGNFVERGFQVQSVSKAELSRISKGAVTVAARRTRALSASLKAVKEEFAIPCSSFCSLVKEIVEAEQERQSSTSNGPIRMEKKTLIALQVAAEEFVKHMFTEGSLYMRHAKRVTLMPSDMHLARRTDADKSAMSSNASNAMSKPLPKRKRM